MLEKIELEKKPFCESGSQNQLVYIFDSNIIAIGVEKTSGKSGLNIFGQALYDARKIGDLVKKNWPSDKREYIENNYFEIMVTEKYSRMEVEDLVYSVIITVLAACDGICSGDTAIIGSFKMDGALKRETSSMRNIRLAEKEGAKNVFVYGTARSYDKKELSRYHLNYRYVKDYKDVLEELKTVSKDKYEQMSLMDFM